MKEAEGEKKKKIFYSFRKNIFVLVLFFVLQN